MARLVSMKEIQTAFSHYLRTKRQNLQLTQHEFVIQLQSKFTSFERLDTATYSRWERGKALPSNLKIIQILQVFSDVQHFFEQFNVDFIHQYLNQSNYFHERFSKFSSKTDNPYLFRSVDYHSQNTKCISTIRDTSYLYGFHKAMYGIEMSKDSSINYLLSGNPYQFFEYHNKSNEKLGHLLLLTLNLSESSSQFEQLFSKTNLCHYSLKASCCKSNETALIIPSSYSSNLNIYTEQFREVIRQLCNNCNCELLILTICNESVFNLYKQLGATVIKVGCTTEHHGVTIGSKKYKWVNCLMKTSEILSKIYSYNE